MASRQRRKLMIVTATNDFDVILGRGKQTGSFPGNIHFRNLAIASAKEYEQCLTSEAKSALSKKVMSRIKSTGGRFLRPVAASDSNGDVRAAWELVSEEEAIAKVKQALRDKTTKRMNATKRRKEKKRLSKQAMAKIDRETTKGREESHLVFGRRNLGFPPAALGMPMIEKEEANAFDLLASGTFVPPLAQNTTFAVVQEQPRQQKEPNEHNTALPQQHMLPRSLNEQQQLVRSILLQSRNPSSATLMSKLSITPQDHLAACPLDDQYRHFALRQLGSLAPPAATVLGTPDAAAATSVSSVFSFSHLARPAWEQKDLFSSPLGSRRKFVQGASQQLSLQEQRSLQRTPFPLPTMGNAILAQGLLQQETNAREKYQQQQRKLWQEILQAWDLRGVSGSCQR